MVVQANNSDKMNVAVKSDVRLDFTITHMFLETIVRTIDLWTKDIEVGLQNYL
jgi:hypothetical protein